MLILALTAMAALSAAAPQNYASQRERSDSRAGGRDAELNTILRGIASMGFPIPPESVTVLRYQYNPPTPSGYDYYYVLSDGTQVAESGGLREDGVFAKKGFYAYRLDKDRQQTVRYTADENGYEPDIIEEPPGTVDCNAFAAAACG